MPGLLYGERTLAPRISKALPDLSHQKIAWKLLPNNQDSLENELEDDITLDELKESWAAGETSTVFARDYWRLFQIGEWSVGGAPEMAHGVSRADLGGWWYAFACSREASESGVVLFFPDGPLKRIRQSGKRGILTTSGEEITWLQALEKVGKEMGWKRRRSVPADR
jgi:hypothetical protein